MPVITGSRGGGSTSPYLTLQWDVIQTDVPNNRSKVRLILKLVSDYNIQFSASKSGRLQGSSFTYTSGARGTGSWTLRTTEVWVSHNSDGTKTQNFNGSLTLGFTFSGVYISTLSVSGNVTLPAIPRQSLLNSASISSLTNDSSSTLTIGITVYHSGFYHLVSVYDGNTWVWDSGYFSGTPDTSYTIPSATVNYMLNLMRTTTSKNFTVRLRTYTSSGGNGLIGTQTRNVSVGVNSSVKPSVSGLSISQEGNSVSNHYLQNLSRVKASFTAYAGYGATISTRTIIVRKVGGSNAQTISEASDTTTNPIASTGSYEVVATARDSRGRTSDVLRETFTATAYNQPTISEFTVLRQPEAQAVVDITRSGNWTDLGGLNVLNISVERRQGTGTWSSVENTTGTNGSFSRAFTNPSNDVSLSYDYRLVISDQFGNYAESMASISTQRVVLDIHKNEGVGIGKIREQGVLDVDGRAYFNGDLYVNNVNVSSAQALESVTQSMTVEDTSTFWQGLPQGTYYVYGNQIPNQPTSYGIMVHSTQGLWSGSDYSTMWYEQSRGMVYRKSGNANNNSPWIPMTIATKSNGRGSWVEFPDGTLIARGTADIKRVNDQTFYGIPITPFDGFYGGGVVVNSADLYAQMRDLWKVEYAFYANGIRFFRSSGDAWGTSGDIPIKYWYIGRWKA